MAEPVEDKAIRERNTRRTSRKRRNISSNHMDMEKTSKVYRTVS